MTEKDEYINRREEYEEAWGQDEFGNIRYCGVCEQKMNIVKEDVEEYDGAWFHRECLPKEI